jgi:hypothetical protein
MSPRPAPSLRSPLLPPPSVAIADCLCARCYAIHSTLFLRSALSSTLWSLPNPLSTLAQPLPSSALFPPFEVAIIGSGPPDARYVAPTGAHRRSFARRRHAGHSEILPFVHRRQPVDLPAPTLVAARFGRHDGSPASPPSAEGSVMSSL